jgi:hypothetical protein
MSQVNQDEEHLRLLSIFHYVLAGVQALMACIPIIHLVVGMVLLVAGLSSREGGPPAVLGLIFMVIALAIIVLGWTTAVLVFLAGRFLSARTHYLYCFIIAAITCAFVPLGTILGVFTIVVLTRPSVKALFEPSAAAQESQ